MRGTPFNVECRRRVGYLSRRAGRGRIALAIRVRGSLRERGRNCFQNTRHIAQHIVVPESQNTVVVIGQPFVADYIAGIFRVLATIHLNNETSFTTNKINRVRPDRLLPDKFVTIEATRPEPIPQGLLRLGGLPSKAPRPLRFALIGSSHVETPPHPDCFAIRPLPARGERLA
jgi:hypothetical protein